jgi:hypothetical protein
MARLVRVGDLEVPQDLELERRDARIRRATMVVAGLILVLACLGLLGGDGVLASRTVSSGTAELTFPRVLQYSDTAELDVRVRGRDPAVGFSNGYLDAVEIQSASPPPLRVVAARDRMIYEFDLRPPATVTFTVEPRSIGSVRGIVYDAAGGSAAFGEWVNP